LSSGRSCFERRQLPPVHAGHADVGEQQIDRALVADERQGFVAAPRGDHVIAERLDDLPRSLENLPVVIDDEDERPRFPHDSSATASVCARSCRRRPSQAGGRRRPSSQG
jgi:hypothetical protein